VSAAGGVDLVQEPIWPQVANALERAATSGIDLTDDLPNLVNGQWVARLRLMHNAYLNPTDNATEPVRGTVGEAARSRVRAQMLATTWTETQSAYARSR
jgi:hypothetical protein